MSLEPIYAAIDENVKSRVDSFIFNRKQTTDKSYTLKRLVEDALDEYMLNHIN